MFSARPEPRRRGEGSTGAAPPGPPRVTSPSTTEEVTLMVTFVAGVCPPFSGWLQTRKCARLPSWFHLCEW
jgi:hypothetical protein